jgi:hypothetical protein
VIADSNFIFRKKIEILIKKVFADQKSLEERDFVILKIIFEIGVCHIKLAFLPRSRSGEIS